MRALLSDCLVQVHPLPLTGCVTLGKSLKFSVPQSPYLFKSANANNDTSLSGSEDEIRKE